MELTVQPLYNDLSVLAFMVRLDFGKGWMCQFLLCFAVENVLENEKKIFALTFSPCGCIVSILPYRDRSR